MRPGNLSERAANAQAETLLRRCTGLRYSGGRLVATDHKTSERLRNLIRGDSRTARGDNDAGGTLELPRSENGPPLIAHIVPLLPVRTLAILDIERPSAAVFVVDPSAELLARVRHFAARFGLTGAETRVLAEIIKGNTVLSAAENLKIAEATARTHLKHILMKTGTTRQTGLIRLFFETSLPSVFPAR
jgi:DNA-binding CsgD family transcriptional regulator